MARIGSTANPRRPTFPSEPVGAVLADAPSGWPWAPPPAIPVSGGADGMRWQLVSAQLPPVAVVAFRKGRAG